jgi:hypothetical protein
MNCPYCGKPMNPSRLSVEYHYKRFHPAEYEVYKQKAIERAAKFGHVGFSRHQYIPEAEKYLIEKCAESKTKRILAAKDKQNGVSHGRAGS